MIEDWILSPFWAPIIFVLIYSIPAFLTCWFYWHTAELEMELATRELAREVEAHVRAMEAHAEQEEAHAEQEEDHARAMEDHARAMEESKFPWPFDY
jgi:hypothetical protein